MERNVRRDWTKAVISACPSSPSASGAGSAGAGSAAASSTELLIDLQSNLWNKNAKLISFYL